MRLIDADKLIAHLEDEIDECKIPFGSRASGKGIAYGTALGLKSAISFAKTAPTVDIKTEVARQIFEEIFTSCVDYCGYIEQPKLAELKNKYIGGVGE